MAIRAGEDTRFNFGGNLSYTPPGIDPARPSVMGAAFRLENDVFNAYELLMRERFQSDPNFDWAAKAAQSPLYMQFPDHFYDVNSRLEWDLREQRLVRELNDRRRIAEAGVPGIAAAMLAGTLTPLVLLPAGQGAVAGSTLKAATSAAKWALLGLSIQEGILHTNQLERTWQESAVGISSGIILAGGLGAAVRYFDPYGLDRVVADMDAGMGTRTISRPDIAPSEKPLDETTEFSDWDAVKEALDLDRDFTPAQTAQAAHAQGIDHIRFGGEEIATARFLDPEGEVDNLLRINDQLLEKYPEAKEAIDDFVAPNGVMSAKGLETAMRTPGSPVLEQLDEIMMPFKAQLRGLVGDEITLYRRQVKVEEGSMGPSNMPDGQRLALSWTADPQYARERAGALSPKLNYVYPDAEIETLVKEFLEKGELRLPQARSTLIDDGEDGVGLYQGNELIVFYSPGEKGIREFFEQYNSVERGLNETLLAKTQEALDSIVTARVKVDDIIYATQKANQMEFIVRNTPDSSAYIGKGTRTESLSAAVVENPDFTISPALPDAGKLLGMNSRIARLFTGTWLGPVTRQAMATWPAARAMMTKLDSGGLYREGNLQGITTAPGGDVASRVSGWHGQLAVATEKHYKLYKEWSKAVKSESALRRFFSGSQAEFSAEITKASRMRLEGLEHPDPRVNAALDEYHSRLFIPMIREAQALGMPSFEKLDLKQVVYSINNTVRRDLANADTNRLRQMVYENALEKLRKSTSVLDDGRVRKALGLDLSFDEYRKALRDGDVLTPEIIADKITDRIMESFTGAFSGHGTVATMTNLGVAKLTPFIYLDPNRVWSNGGTFNEFLDQDMERIARGWTRRFSADLELYRTFQTIDPRGKQGENTRPYDDLRKQWSAALEKADEIEDTKLRQKTVKEINQLREGFEKDFDTVVGRIRNDWGAPADPSAIGYRAGRAILNLNVLRLMGTVMLSSVPDLARPVMKYGAMNTFRDGYLQLLTNFDTFKMTSAEAKYAGAAIELSSHGRATGTFDLQDELMYGNRAERMLQTATNRFGFVAGFDLWTDFNKRLVGNVLLGQLSKAMQDEAAGIASKQQKLMLRSLFIDERTAKEIAELMRQSGKGTEVRPGVFFPNTEEWGKIDGKDVFDPNNFNFRADVDQRGRIQSEKEMELARVFRAALVRGINDTIITPGAERPSWVDSATGARILSQFRSFTMSSQIKTVMAAYQDARVGNMAPVVLGTTFSLALGMLSYYLWAVSVGGKTQQRMENERQAALSGNEEAMGRWVDEGLARSGLLGIFAEAQKFAERIPALQPYATFGDSPTARSPFVNPVAEALGPSIGLVNNLDRVLRNMDDPTADTFANARRILPYQNIFYLRQALDYINDQAMLSVGVTPR